MATKPPTSLCHVVLYSQQVQPMVCLVAPNHFSSSELFPERPFLCWLLGIAFCLRFLWSFWSSFLAQASTHWEVPFSVTSAGWSWKFFSLSPRSCSHELFFLYFPVLCFTWFLFWLCFVTGAAGKVVLPSSFSILLLSFPSLYISATFECRPVWFSTLPSDGWVLLSSQTWGTNKNMVCANFRGMGIAGLELSPSFNPKHYHNNLNKTFRQDNKEETVKHFRLQDWTKT